MDKEDVAHIYNGILLSHKKNEIEFFIVRWMYLETVIQSEVSQKEKYYMISLIHGISKRGTNELIYKTEIELQM